jgi:hypothetical protein
MRVGREAVHKPYCHAAGGVPPKDVRLTIAIEVAGFDDHPIGASNGVAFC